MTRLWIPKAWILLRFVTLAAWLSSQPVCAEHRVFELQLKSATGDVSLIRSTLDPEQYRHYYHVPQGTTVSYLQTWRCEGRTSHQPLCKSPKERDAEAAAASLASPTESLEKQPSRQPASALGK